MIEHKVGDRVRNIHEGGPNYQLLCSVYRIDSDSSSPVRVRYDDGSHGQGLHEEYATIQVNFVLKYDLHTDPIELYETMKEVENRIKELALRSDLQRESIRVYEVSKTNVVVLDTKISFRGVATAEVVATTAPAKRRAGRLKQFTEEQLKARKRRYMRRYNKRYKAQKLAEQLAQQPQAPVADEGTPIEINKTQG